MKIIEEEFWEVKANIAFIKRIRFSILAQKTSKIHFHWLCALEMRWFLKHSLLKKILDTIIQNKKNNNKIHKISSSIRVNKQFSYLMHIFFFLYIYKLWYTHTKKTPLIKAIDVLWDRYKFLSFYIFS